MLKWAYENQCPWYEEIVEELCSLTAEKGNIEMLKWARANRSHAALYGHLELLKWARANLCPWNENTCSKAAEMGQGKSTPME